MISLNKEFQEVLNKFHHTLQRRFNLSDLPGKLQSWHQLTYAEFIKELGKKKIRLSLSEEAEWEEYFNQEKQKALELKTKIDATDKEIDRMVYELYGLTEEEIRIVEDSWKYKRAHHLFLIILNFHKILLKTCFLALNDIIFALITPLIVFFYYKFPLGYVPRVFILWGRHF